MYSRLNRNYRAPDIGGFLLVKDEKPQYAYLEARVEHIRPDNNRAHWLGTCWTVYIIHNMYCNNTLIKSTLSNIEMSENQLSFYTNSGNAVPPMQQTLYVHA